MKNTDDPVRAEREQAWLGDAVLGLFARRWILDRTGAMDQELFAAMTSNAFLSTVGNPTRVEGAIGREYLAGGLDAAFRRIEADILPVFLKQQRGRLRKAPPAAAAAD